MSERAQAAPRHGGPTHAAPAQAGIVPDGSGAEGEAARAARELEGMVRETEVAAREWGVRPDHLEGRFVAAMLSALTWLGRLIRAAMADMKASSREVRVASVAELERLRVANQASATVLEQARVALAGSEVQRERVIGRFVEAVAPQIVEAIREAVVLRERRYNQHVQWGRAAGIAALAAGILVGGYVWGGSRNSAEASAGAVLLDRVRQCQAAPVKDGRTGEAYCLLRMLVAPS